MKIKQAIEQSYKILSGIQSKILDTHLLLAHFLGKTKLFVLTNPEYEVMDADGFFDLINRRAKGEPVAYIIGKAEFMSLDFEVNRHTLIPRSDTETLVEFVISRIGNNNFRFLDIGTGSGCIVVSVAKYCKNASGVAVDISHEALVVAKRNACSHNVNIDFIEMDILNDFPKDKFDIIISNPPYIENDVIPTLEDTVKNFEPYTALYGGYDGLDFYRRISSAAKDSLTAGGVLAFEIGHTQYDAVSEIMNNNGYKNISAAYDLSGIKRIVYGEI